MAERRERGEGGLSWDESRQRWTATASLGHDPAGKRIVKKARGRTKTEAKNKLKEMLRDLDDGLATAPSNYTVGDAVREWLQYGLRAGGTRDAGPIGSCARSTWCPCSERGSFET